MAVQRHHQREVSEEADGIEDEGQHPQIACKVDGQGREPAPDKRPPDRAREPDQVLDEESAGGAEAVADGSEDREADGEARGLLVVEEVVDDLWNGHEHEEVRGEPPAQPAQHRHETRRPQQQQRQHHEHAGKAGAAKDPIVVGHNGRTNQGQQRTHADGGRDLLPQGEAPRGQAPDDPQQGDDQTNGDDGCKDEEGNLRAVACKPYLHHHGKVCDCPNGLDANGCPLLLAGEVSAKQKVTEGPGYVALPREASELGAVFGLEILDDLRHLQRKVGKSGHVDRDLGELVHALPPRILLLEEGRGSRSCTGLRQHLEGALRVAP
mmetsp:Transcript_57025/g.169653  ORF Transcript_57025/g.169653 Transcript_57025/m.169653 type:complete len:323 (+) Transcript_57025:184-1152(+)